MDRSIKIYNNKKNLFLDTAELFFSEAQKAINAHGKFSVAISGGSTPVPLYELLSSAEYRSRIDWKLIHFFWADERCVPKNHPDSNFKMAYELFLSKQPIPDSNIHRIHGELDAKTAASEYEIELMNYFGKSALPAIDLVFLGVGEDGHTASIFPGLNSGTINSRTVICVYVKRLKSNRVSLSLPVLDNSGTVAFIVIGNSKAHILREIFEDSNSDSPAAKVNPKAGRNLWFLDQDAASMLTFNN